tara:strand:- start:21 stop:884 length:864 start_codon:yes stop_codon:yes gene_type:complete
MYKAAIVGPHTCYIVEDGKKFYLLFGDKHDEILSSDAVEYSKSIASTVYNYIEFFEKVGVNKTESEDIVVFIEAPIGIYNNTINIPSVNDKRWKQWIEQNSALDVLQWFLYKHPNIKVIPVDIRFDQDYEFLHNMSLDDFFKFLNLDTLYCLEDFCDMDVLQAIALSEKDYKLLNILKRLYSSISTEKIEVIKNFFISKFLDNTIFVKSLLVDLYVIGLLADLQDHTSTIFMMGSLHIKVIKEFLEYLGMNMIDCQHVVGDEKVDQVSVFTKKNYELLKQYFLNKKI